MSTLAVDNLNLKGSGLVSSVGNVMEILSSPANGTQVTVPSGTYTMADVTAIQQLTTSYADLSGSSINYTPPSGTTRVMYKYYSQFAYDGTTYGNLHCKLFLDGSEVTDARRTFYATYLAGAFTFEYTINCNAGSANTDHGDITSWTTPKIIKLQAREYDGSNQGKFFNVHLWDGGNDTTSVVPPVLTITALRDN
tara:strand:+ start:129 stop:713 length:585 start_codon:yes stop_codon:yes gene_type:complete